MACESTTAGRVPPSRSASSAAKRASSSRPSRSSASDIAVEHRPASAAQLHHLLQVAQREAVVALAQADQRQVEARVQVVRLQLGHAPELARRLVEHPRAVERDPQVAVLVDARLRHLARLRGRAAPHRVREPGLDEPEQRLGDVELHHPDSSITSCTLRFRPPA
jgi:hypothetical protein